MLCFVFLAMSHPAVVPARASATASEAIESGEKARREAWKSIRKGRYDKAIKIFSALLAEHPADVDAGLGISLAYMKSGNFQSCYDHANRVLKEDPENARAHALMGLALLRSGFIPAAIGELVEAIKIDKREPLAFGAAAEIDYYEGRAKDARQKAYYAHTLDPDEPDYLITYARASSRVEMFTDAADAYERYLDVAPKSEKERRERIRGLIRFYRRLSGIKPHQIRGPKQVEVRFRLENRRPHIKVKVNGQEATFVVDTGSGFTVISKDAADRLGVREVARGGKSQGFGGDGKFAIVYGLINSLHLGEAKIEFVPCFIRPFHVPKGQSGNDTVDGYVGLSVLSSFLTEIDYMGGVLRLDRDPERPLQLAGSPEVTVVPFRTTQNGLISVEAKLDDAHSINVIVDSGASMTAISAAAVDRLRLRESVIKGQTVQVVGAAGISDNVELVFLRNCRIANLGQDNLRAMILNFEAINETSGFEQSGILGGNFLGHFRMTIDFPRGQLIFYPITSAVTRQQTEPR